MVKNWILLLTLAVLVSGCEGMPRQPAREPSWVGEQAQLGLRVRVVSSEDLPGEIVGDRKQVLQVVKVHTGLPAQWAGVRRDDKLLQIDGKPVSNMYDSVAIMEGKRRGGAVVLTILRDGELQTFRVDLARTEPREEAESSVGE